MLDIFVLIFELLYNDRMEQKKIIQKNKKDPFKLMEEQTAFFLAGNCDKCTPCREGIYRIDEMIKNKEIDEKALDDIFFVLEETSLCPFGKKAGRSLKTLMKKIIE